jgi:SAM-dependent methyltransferase
MDWNARWRKKLEEASFRLRHTNLNAFWDVKAEAYSQMEEADGVRRARKIVDLLPIVGDTTILEIGSGPGTLTIPLAKAAKQVTAVDPSRGMLSLLKENANQAGLMNIRTIHAKWEDVELQRDIEGHDIVIASYALAMPELRQALVKMHEATLKAVYLYWYADDRSDSVYSDLWPMLFHGETYIHFPDYIYVVNILYLLGIYANTEIVEDISYAYFSSLDEAVEYWKQNFGIVSPKQTNIIREYLSEKLVKKSNAFLLRRQTKMAHIFWNKQSTSKS